MTSIAGRGLFTATAAFALIGGGAGMAFAGEAPAGDHDGGGDGHGDGQHCTISIVDPTVAGVEHTAADATDNGTTPLTDTVTDVTQPAHDFLCPPVDETIDRVTGTGDTDPAAAVQGAVDQVTSGTSSAAPTGLPS